jgi:phosphoribosylamine--glycine ligase
MGAYSPAPVVTPEIHAKVMREVIFPTLKGMQQDGIPYTGFLYAGLMIDRAGRVLVLEFNCRMGDPETQPIMMRLKSDLLQLLWTATDSDTHLLANTELKWDRRSALGVVLAAANYPATPETGQEIRGLGPDTEEAMVFHAGTVEKDGKVLTSGGRVLCVTALGDTVKQAQTRAYELADKVSFQGMQMRRDIGFRAIRR